jgi:hypothetical protein
VEKKDSKLKLKDFRKNVISSAMRFFRNAQKQCDTNFGKLQCLKISQYIISPVFETGDINTHRVFPPYYEWKCDWGIPEPQ